MWLIGRWWSKPVLLAGVAGLVAGLVVFAWWIDGRMHVDRPIRNVALGERLVGGVGPSELDLRLESMAANTETARVSIDMGDRTIEAFAGDVGITLDVDATRRSLLDTGRTGSLWDQIQGWARNLDGRRPVAPLYTFDEDTARAWLSEHPAAIDRQPVHPSATFDGEMLVAVPGAPGRGLDVDAIVAELALAVDAGSFSEIDGHWREIPSPIPLAEAESLVAGVRNRLGAGVVVTLRDTARWIPPKPLYSWLSTTSESGSLELVFDGQSALSFVESLFADVSVGSLQPEFRIEDGVPVVVEVADRRTVCCSARLVPMLEAVISGDSPQPIEVPLRDPTVDESLLVARQYGIRELVSEFTTEHACCASRVTNIHRIADLVRGYVIPPGGEFSINDYVGRRTRDKGFVSAGVIQSGRFHQSVGGGISQFATTLFNAAFFAGMDIPEYQSHSIYISRYPYGREATVSFPAPDLVIHNPTPYHVLIWTSYTDTSITVQMYSTPYATVTETGQTVGRAGACTRVETFRERAYPDGRIDADSVFAIYRPGEGLDCRGRPTPQP